MSVRGVLLLGPKTRITWANVWRGGARHRQAGIHAGAAEFLGPCPTGGAWLRPFRLLTGHRCGSERASPDSRAERFTQPDSLGGAARRNGRKRSLLSKAPCARRASAETLPTAWAVAHSKITAELPSDAICRAPGSHAV